MNNIAIPTMFCLRIPWRKQGPQWSVPHGSCLWKSYWRGPSSNSGFRLPSLLFFLNQLFLKYSLHTINCIHFKCTITAFWQVCTPTIIKVWNSFITPESSPMPLSSKILPCLCTLEATDLLSIFHCECLCPSHFVHIFFISFG